MRAINLLVLFCCARLCSLYGMKSLGVIAQKREVPLLHVIVAPMSHVELLFCFLQLAVLCVIQHPGPIFLHMKL